MLVRNTECCFIAHSTDSPIWMKESEPEGMTSGLLLSNDTDLLEEKQGRQQYKNITLHITTRHLHETECKQTTQECW